MKVSFCLNCSYRVESWPLRVVSKLFHVTADHFLKRVGDMDSCPVNQ